MSTHISTANTYTSAIDTLMSRQTQLANTQGQMTTGKRVSKASDDPAAAARAERALAAEQRATAYQRGVDASANAMTLTDSALSDAGDLLQQAREAMVEAGNASYSDAQRATVADKLADLRQQLFAVANRSDGNGRYLFAGQGATAQPFVDAPGGVQYQGDAGHSLSAAGGDPLPLTTDGASTWMTAPSGNGVFTTGATTSTGSAWIDAGTVTNPSALTGATYSIQFSTSGSGTTYSVLKNGVATAQTNVAFTSGQAIQVDGMSATISGQPANGDAFQLAPSTPTQSVFDTLDKAIADLRTPSRSGAQIAQANSTNLENLDAVMGRMSAVRAQVGASLNRADAATDRLAAQKLSAQTEQSNATDVDMTQAISDFTNQQTGYDAALKAYSMVQKLSLFNYIGS